MPQVTGGGSSIKKSRAKAYVLRSMGGEKSNPKVAARSSAAVQSKSTGTRSAVRSTLSGKTVSKVYKAKAAKKYLAKSSGTTTGEVRGVLKAVRRGEMSKGAATKALKGGPTAGVPAGNKRRVQKSIRRALAGSPSTLSGAGKKQGRRRIKGQ